MRRTNFLWPILATLTLAVAGCARHESPADREAEINRRVQQRLAVEREARDREALAQHTADLAKREHELAAREAFLAEMTASILRESAQPESSDNGLSDDATEAPAAPDNSFVANDPVYSDPYGYTAPNEPRFWNDPGFVAPIVPSVTVINQTSALIYVHRRPRRPRRDGNQGGKQPRRASTLPPMMVAPRTTMPQVFHHPTTPAPIVRPAMNSPHVAPRNFPRPVANKGIKANPN